jgi:hypothetical protein
MFGHLRIFVQLFRADSVSWSDRAVNAHDFARHDEESPTKDLE